MQSMNPSKKKPMIPSLKVGGLGLSSIAKDGDGGKTQEELDVANIVAGNKMEPLKPDESQNSVIADQPKKVVKKPFIPPLKGAASLGLSTLLMDNGKTREEQDVANQVASNNMTS